MLNSTCEFCNEIKGHACSVWNQLRGNLPADRILYRTEPWLIMPPLGCFVPGGLLLLTPQHIGCCAELSTESTMMLDALLDKTGELIKSRFGNPALFFEHGPGCGSKGACCVDHAHVNVFPAKCEIWSDLSNLGNPIKIQRMSDLSALAGREYLWIRDGSGRSEAYIVDGVPSQFIRTVLTRKLGIPERWHWREYLGLTEIRQTIDALQGAWE